MKTLTTVSIIVCLGICGCARTLTTSPYRLSEANSGVVYSLPKTKLKVTVTYTVRSETKLENGVPVRSTKDIIISKPVLIEPLLLPDTGNTFVLSGEKMVKDARLDASFKFQLNDNQLLASVTSEAFDKSPEIFQGLVGSGISIAKMVAVAGEQPPTPLKEIGERISQINGELAALAKSTDTNKIAKIEFLLKEQTTLLDAAKKFLENNAPKTEEKDIAYSQILDLSDFKRDKNVLVAEVTAPAAKLGDFGQSAVPVTKIELFVTEEQFQNANKRFFSQTIVPTEPSKNSNNKPSTQASVQTEPSVIYRVPTPVRVRITVAPKNVVVFDDEIAFAQLGPFNKVEAKYKVWAKRKTQITFSPVTGSIKEYGVDSTSSAEAAAKALDTSLSKVQSAVGDFRKAQDAVEAATAAAKKTPEQIKLADLEQQKKLLEAEASLIKAQQELDKLKSGSGSQ